METSLASKLAIGDTSATLYSATDDDGVALPTGRYYLTLDGNNSSKEHIVCTLTSTALTEIKSVSRQGVETDGVSRAHRIGAKVILTDFANIKLTSDMLNGDTALNGSSPLIYDTDPTLTDDKHIATKKYIDDIAIAGAAKATTAVYGISKLSTAPVSSTAPIAVGDNDTRVPSQEENDAMVGTSGTPSSSNKYVTNNDTSSTSTTASIIVRRNATGDITVPLTPTATTDAASKAYVGTQVSNTNATLFRVEASDVLVTSDDTNVSGDYGAYTKVKEILYNDISGTIRIVWTVGSATLTKTKIYKNGSAFGSEHTGVATFTENLAFATGDLIQLYAYGSASVAVDIGNFRLKYSKYVKEATNTVNL